MEDDYYMHKFAKPMSAKIYCTQAAPSLCLFDMGSTARVFDNMFTIDMSGNGKNNLQGELLQIRPVFLFLELMLSLKLIPKMCRAQQALCTIVGILNLINWYRKKQDSVA